MLEFRGGYAGCAAEFDLSSETEARRLINEDESLNQDLRLYIGGRGLGVKLLHDNLPKGTHPLSQKNIMIFATGPLSGTISPTPGRMTVTSKSPLTGTISTSNSGSRHFARVLKQAGFDAFVLRGKASEYSYLYISDDGFVLKDAEDLMGSSTGEATKKLKEIYGERCGVITTGPAAEKGVLFASMLVDGMNVFGRGGLGAILSSKNLKAIVVVSGGTPPKHADPSKFKYEEGTPLYEAVRRGIANNRVTKVLGVLGTPGLIEPVNDLFGALPTRNFRDSCFEGADALKGETFQKTLRARKDGCFGCLIRCKRRTEAGGEEGHGPEYETIYALGPSLGVGNLELIARLNYLCNELGMDTITTGLTIACAMDMFEDGIITGEDTDGIELRFGSGKELMELVRSIGFNRGFGSILAKGSYRLAEHFGHPEYSMSVNKLELPAYDPRVFKGMSLVFGQSNRGACHLRGGLTTSYELYGSPKIVDPLGIAGKGVLAARCQDAIAYLDSLIGCVFASPAVGSDIWARLLSASVFGDGRSYSAEDLMEVGERIYSLERWFNCREGIPPSNYKIPERLLTKEVRGGPSKGERLTEEEHRLMEEEYYEVRGWEEGVPTMDKLKELKIIK